MERQKSCGVRRLAEDAGEHPCGVCRKGVDDNSIVCVECHNYRWVHKRCSDADCHCRRCLEGENGLFQSVLLKDFGIEPNVKLECVPKFCYLRDTIGAGGGRGGLEEAARARVRCAWAKFKELRISYSDDQGCIIPHKGK